MLGHSKLIIIPPPYFRPLDILDCRTYGFDDHFPSKLWLNDVPFSASRPHQFLGSEGMRNNELIWSGLNTVSLATSFNFKRLGGVARETSISPGMALAIVHHKKYIHELKGMLCLSYCLLLPESQLQPKNTCLPPLAMRMRIRGRWRDAILNQRRRGLILAQSSADSTRFEHTVFILAIGPLQNQPRKPENSEWCNSSCEKTNSTPQLL